jgi:hypothetical protein
MPKTLDDPRSVVVLDELPDGDSGFLNRLETVDVEHLLLEGVVYGQPGGSVSPVSRAKAADQRRRETGYLQDHPYRIGLLLKSHLDERSLLVRRNWLFFVQLHGSRHPSILHAAVVTRPLTFSMRSSVPVSLSYQPPVLVN